MLIVTLCHLEALLNNDLSGGDNGLSQETIEQQIRVRI